ncbi:MAG TPA: type VI secretion system membrane subunit TssM [Geminicoccaceae bacterium]|nr:type VI secretion system membrane subunit TssM [Geminicoccus sp.]HMU48667.1 type VI secretion system membrane subunit TssM [Geminicoccaceae bacterium]
MTRLARGLLPVLLSRAVVSLIGAAAMALVVWFFGPLVSIGGWVPLGGDTARLLAVLAISLLWGAGNLWSAHRARAGGEAMVEAIAKPSPGPADAELGAIAARFKEVMARLKAHRFAKGRLYQLPWYLLIGPPGSGKTTALLQSGLRFPLEGLQELKGVGGTRHCDWFFTDEAVLIDTAGRWTTQDSDRTTDASAWLGFLDLLEKHRPREPINGVVVALAVDDLVAAGAPGLETTAGAVRARLNELGARLGLHLPVYLLLTKADLIAGFREAFADLDDRAREQVWGFTLPLQERETAPGREAVERELALLVDRAEARTLGRLETERDLDRRAAIQGLPLQLAALTEPLQRFIALAFVGTGYEMPPLLRGVYLSSGTQSGAPIDRLLADLQRRFGIRVGPAHELKGNQSFFLLRLLREVIFAEAPLVRLASRLERRERRRAQAAWAVAATAVLLVLGGWIWAYRVQAGAVTAYLDAVREYRSQAAAVATDSVGAAEEDLRPIVPALDAAQTLAVGIETPSPRLGLSQARQLRAHGSDVYDHALQAILLPRLVRRVETRLRAELDTPEAAIGALKVYLALGGQGALSPGLVTDWMAEDLRRAYPLDQPVRDRLDRHLGALVERLPTVDPRPSLDPGLIDSALSAIDRVPPSKRAYLALVRKHGELGQPFEPSKVAGPEASALFPMDRGSALATPIPELFTRRGFWQRFLPSMAAEARAVAEEDAAMHPGRPKLDEGGQARLLGEMLDLYYAETIDRWQKLEHGLGLRLPDSLGGAASVLRPLAVPPSPLVRLLQAMVDETLLTAPPQPPEPTGNAGDQASPVQDAAVGAARQALGGRDPEGPPLGAPVEARFRPLALAIRGEAGAPARLDSALQAANELYLALPSPGTPSTPATASQIRAQAERLAEAVRDLPAALREPLERLAQRLGTLAEGQVLTRINDEYRAKVLPFCRQATSGRFPFDPDSTADVSHSDLARLFGAGGLFDQFIEEQLTSFVDTAQRPWRWSASIGSSDAALAPFEAARRLRDGLFAGGTAPRVGFTLRPTSLGEDVERIVVDLDGQTASYEEEPPQPVHLDWPGPYGGGRVQISFEPDGWWTDPVTTTRQGSWSWVRLLHEGGLTRQGRPDLYIVTLAAGPHQASFELVADSVDNPFELGPFQRFRCPEGL